MFTLGRNAHSIVQRARPQVLRIACIYGLLDGSKRIKSQHLRAALAVWRYCEASARHIFGGTVGDLLADTICGFLREHGALSTTEIHKELNGHKTKEDVHEALTQLRHLKLVKRKQKKTKGRHREVWRLRHARKGKAA